MSKIKIGTVGFQDMVARAVKGASGNRLLPITSMMAVELKSGTLTLTTTDTANTLKVMSNNIQGDDFYAVVPVELFSKLIAKMTSDSIELILNDTNLEVKGNGTYNVPLPVDEGGMVKFPSYSFQKDGEGDIIEIQSIKDILEINKASVAKSIDTPCLCGYYLGDRVITTDEQTICFNDIHWIFDEYLVSPEMMELLALCKEEKIRWWYKDGYFLFETDTFILYGAEHDGKDLFPAQEVLSYLAESFPSGCKLPKLLLQNVVDRLSLFIEPYDKNGAYFTFTQDGVKVTSKKSSCNELIPYMESEGFAPFRCCLDIPMLKDHIDASPGETIELWYGHEACIKLISGNVVQVIALLVDDEMEAVGE